MDVYIQLVNIIVRYIEFEYGNYLLPLFMNSSGSYANKEVDDIPSPQDACSPGICRLNTAAMEKLIHTFVI